MTHGREEEAEEIKLTAAVVAAELTQEPGFLSWVGMEIGSRLYTITAWESPDAVRAVMRNSTHLAAVKRFFTEDFGAAAAPACGPFTTSTRSGCAALPARS